MMPSPQCYCFLFFFIPIKVIHTIGDIVKVSEIFCFLFLDWLHQSCVVAVCGVLKVKFLEIYV